LDASADGPRQIAFKYFEVPRASDLLERFAEMCRASILERIQSMGNADNSGNLSGRTTAASQNMLVFSTSKRFKITHP
jgi:hypothetical protein